VVSGQTLAARGGKKKKKRKLLITGFSEVRGLQIRRGVKGSRRGLRFEYTNFSIVGIGQEWI